MEDFFASVIGAIRWVGAAVCNLIYNLISWIYQVFMTIAQLDILSNETVEPIYQRITLILTIVMVFYITFEFVKYVVQPEGITDKEKGVGNIAIRLVIVIVLIAFVPKIFSMAFDIQSRIINTQVFSKVILGKQDADFKTLGGGFSADVLELFYKVDDDFCEYDEDDDEYGGDYESECEDAADIIEDNIDDLNKGKNVDITEGITEVIVVEDGDETTYETPIQFNGLFAIIVGLFIIYILVMYCIDLGVRYAQMLYLQIIAPIAIMGYISPKKDNMFQKWIKQCTTTYIDLFIRLAIIYFVLLIIGILGDAFNDGSLFSGLGTLSWDVKMVVYIALILGLLIFAQKAPKMLQELFPMGGGAASIGYGLGTKDKMEAGKRGFGYARMPWNAGKRAAGAVSGAGMGLASAWKNRHSLTANNTGGFGKTANWLRSAGKASARGIKAGASKGGSIRRANLAAHESIEKDVKVVDDGGTVIGHDFLGAHYQHQKVVKEREISEKETVTKAKKTVSTATEDVKVMKNMKSIKEDWNTRGFGDASDREAAYKDIEKATRVFAVSKQDAAAKLVYEQAIQTALNGKLQADGTIKGGIYNVDNHAAVRNLQASVATAERQVAAFDAITTPLTSEQIEQRNAAIMARDEAIRARDTEIEKIKLEREKVYQTLTSVIGADPEMLSALRTEIVEAKRVSAGQGYGKKDANGQYTKRVDSDTTTIDKLEEFAKSIGDVADAAREQIAELTYDAETRKAKANADPNAGGGSDKK